MTRLAIGISPCPNDTYAFHGLLSGAVRAAGLELDFVLADVQELNERLARGDLDASKASFAAGLALGASHVVLDAGSALGFGVGPLLLAAPGARAGAIGDARVLTPGAATTAHLLYRLFHPGEGRVDHVPFSEILPALAARRAEFGVCIHEGRFTYRSYGLDLVEDLGATWERSRRLPLPLGGILARRSLGRAAHRALAEAIRASLAHADAHRAEALATMRAHARELDDAVLWAHVELYVNAWTRSLGREGALALAALGEAARAARWIGADAAALEVCAP